MNTVIDNSKKIEIVRAFLTEKPETKTGFAAKHGISVRTLSRYVEAHGAEVAKEIEDAKKPAKAVKVASSGGRYRARSNGFIQIAYETVKAMGEDAKTADIYKALVDKRKEANMAEITQSGAYTIISKLRKIIKAESND